MSAEFKNPIRGKAIITGTSGFIGSQLRDRLIADGLEVVSLVRPSSPPARKGRAVAADYADLRGLRSIFREEKPDYVFHVAGATKGVTYADFQAGNVMPTQNLLTALREEHLQLKRFVHVSSASSYGPSNAGRPKHESDPREPVEHYGRSKLEAELALESFGDALAWTIIRPVAVYGPAETDMFALFRSAKLGVNLFYGNRQKRISAVFVHDLIDGMLLAAGSDVARWRGYFLCDGVPYTWGDIQGHIVQAVGRRTLTLNLPGFLVPAAGAAGELMTALDKKPRLFNRQKAILDAQQAWLFTHASARKDFGYAPRVPIAEGMKRTYEWYVENGWL